MDAWRFARSCLPLLAGALLLPAAHGTAAPSLTISGSDADADVRSVTRPTPSRRFTVDVTPPGVTIRTPTANTTYLPGDIVMADFACSGAVSCTGTVADGTPLPTATPGPASLNVTAVDAAGDATTRAVAFAVGSAAPVITARPAGPVRDARPVFAWTGGDPGATFTWQVLSGGAVISQGDTLDTQVALGPLMPGAYAFQVRQTIASGRAGPYSVADPFVVTKVVADVALLRPSTLNAAALRPRPGRVVTATRPLLRWRAAGGADLYNLQVFRVTTAGMRKVRSLFPTVNRTRVAGLRPGQRYAWGVWPYDRARGGYARQPLGLSWFELRRPVRPSHTQMGTDRSIATAALRKAVAIEAWLDAGIAPGDLRHQGLGAAAFDPALQPTGPPAAGGTAAASVRPIVVPAGPPGRARLPVNARELRHTKRIARAALARVAAIEARLEAGLTGGDVIDGAIGPEKLAPNVALGRRRAATTAQPPSATPPAPPIQVPAVPATRANIVAGRRLAQGAVRRAEALRRRLLQGLSSADFTAGSIGAADLARTLRR